MAHVSRSTAATAEELRLQEARSGVPWRAWGPYLSERQWGTVREDYSEDGEAWSYLTHDQARSRAYRWGEDGLAGISDDTQTLCLALALWNGRDPILKERLFGLTNVEGNHGEDVKEYYFYLDNLPTHSYQRLLYKYPHAAYPYRGTRCRQRRPDPPRNGSSSCSTLASSTAIATSTSRSSMRRWGPRTSSAASPRTIAPASRHRSKFCRRCGTATPGPGRPVRRSRESVVSSRCRARWRGPSTRRSEPSISTWRTAPACSSARTRPTGRGSRERRRSRAFRRMASAITSCMAPRPSIPRPREPRSQRTSASRCRRGAAPRST